MSKFISDLKNYQNIKRVTRFFGMIVLVLFFILFFDNLFNRSYEWYFIAAISLIAFLYLMGIASLINNNLLNGIIIISSVILFQITLLLSYPEASILNSYILMLPGGLIILVHLLTRKEFLNIDDDFRNMQQKNKITMNMMEIIPNILANDNLDDVLQKILDKAVEIMPKVQNGSILIRHGEVMRFHAAVGYDLNALKKIELKLEEMFQYKLGVLHEPLIMQDIKTFNEKNIEKGKTKIFGDNNALIAKSVLTCSIKLHGKIYGFINLDNVDSHDVFDETDKTYIKHLATQIDIALNNHLLVQDIYRLSRYDSLTGANTRKYNSELMNQVKKTSNLEGKKFSVCVIDINDLKKVNDQFGHEAGDQYLIHFSKIAYKIIDEDVVFSRTGGDEFIVTFPETTKIEATKKIEKLREMVKKEPLEYNKEIISINFGFGISEFPTDSEEISNLVQIADHLMYQDKQKIKKQV